MVWSTKQLKERFSKFFEKRGHKVLPSSSVVPKNDPTLLFTNSGMVQFKDIFMGGDTKYKRVCTSQNCIRAGGKHNDLEDVGKDNYHHTFFEMLGNWSFGDYFKEDAIKFAYEFLVEDLKLDKERLYVTIYEEMDSQSKSIWLKYLPESRIISASAKDNFWEMGEFGPCGACTEIHYDRIGGRDASHLVNQDSPSVIEIWNIVFMEYERTPKGLIPLEVKNIDTGIGLERLLSILMNVESNYLIDSFQHIIKFLESNCEFKYQDKDNLTDVAFRVISDHARTLAVCLNDKVTFSSEGVGYVVRRILRRAVRYGNDTLKLEKGILAQTVLEAGKFMGYNIDVSIINEEEKLFFKTLLKGKVVYQKMVKEKGSLNGKDVFILYDTYGFPKDLTELMAREDNVDIDMIGFEEAKNAAKELSKTTRSVITLNFNFPKTDDSFKYEDNNGLSAKTEAIVLNNEIVSNIQVNVNSTVIFDKTCFYGECGGQVGDVGMIEFYENEEDVGLFRVLDTQIQRGYVLHHGILKEGRVGTTAKLSYDTEIRERIACNHSTAHILNAFLRKFNPTKQEGSLVDAEKCRFDFEGKKLSDSILEQLEDDMNLFIKSGATVNVEKHSRDQILTDSSVIKMEGESYPEEVRLIVMKNEDITIKEICGGTHVKNTSQIKHVRIVSESGIKANTRRIVIYSGRAAEKLDENGKNSEMMLKMNQTISTDVSLSLRDRRRLEKINNELLKKKATELKTLIKDTEKSVKERLLIHKMDALMLDKPFYYEILGFDKASVKDRKKILADITSKIGVEVNNSIILIPNNDEYNICLTSNNLDDISSNILKDFGVNFSIISNKYIAGSIPKDSFSKEKISSYFK